MNKNATPIILIILAIGIYFSFTRAQYAGLESIKKVNAQYKEAIDNSQDLINTRNDILETYNRIDPEDQERLEKLVPTNVDTVRLIIDVNGVAARHSLAIKNIKTNTDKVENTNSRQDTNTSALYNTATLSFDVASNYPNFINFMKDLEASLRIMEVSKISLRANDIGTYDYGVEIKTFWLKQ